MTAKRERFHFGAQYGRTGEGTGDAEIREKSGVDWRPTNHRTISSVEDHAGHATKRSLQFQIIAPQRRCRKESSRPQRDNVCNAQPEIAELTFDAEVGHTPILFRMDIERVIHDIEQLEEMFESPDIRPFKEADILAANRRHDEALASSPWFRLWQSYGVCCRTEAPIVQFPE